MYLVISIAGVLMVGVAIPYLIFNPSIGTLHALLSALLIMIFGLVELSIAPRKHYARSTAPPTQRSCAIYLLLLLAVSALLLTLPSWVLADILPLIPCLVLTLGLSLVFVLEILRRRKENV